MIAEAVGGASIMGQKMIQILNIFFLHQTNCLHFFIMPNDTTECDTEIESKNAALFKRYGNLDQVFFVHTSISIRDHERIFSNFCIKW